MKHYFPTGRRNYGRPLKRLLDTRDRNGSTSGPTACQIYDDDDDDDDDMKKAKCVHGVSLNYNIVISVTCKLCASLTAKPSASVRLHGTVCKQFPHRAHCTRLISQVSIQSTSIHPLSRNHSHRRECAMDCLLGLIGLNTRHQRQGGMTDSWRCLVVRGQSGHSSYSGWEGQRLVSCQRTEWIDTTATVAGRGSVW